MTLQELDRLETFLDKLNRREIEQNNDRVILIIGDEGVGKSTLMLEATALWHKVRGLDRSVDGILSRVVWGGRDEFNGMLANSDEGSIITVQDAARALYKRDAMDPQQKHTEKNLLDIRTLNYVILLGYQDFDDVPTSLARRRAATAFRITSRGHVKGYSRSSLDTRFESGDWPDPDFRDRFPDLEGTELWDRFSSIDAEKKLERLTSDDGDEEDQLRPRDVVDEILTEGVGEYVETNEFNGQTYVSKSLIKLDYPALSEQEADQVKHGLRREVDLEEFGTDTAEGEGGTPHV